MKKTLKIYAWIGIVIGSLSILYSFEELTVADFGYALVGGGLYLSWGILTLTYIKKK